MKTNIFTRSTFCTALVAAALFFGGCENIADVAPSATGTLDSKGSTKIRMDVLTLRAENSSQVTISVEVMAGATGAPAGFSLQWMLAADLAANDNVWYSSDDPRLCKASFSGNANMSRYNLSAFEKVTVDVGELLLDNGASTNCGGLLECGTEYVFRAFAHANSSLMRSDFTSNFATSTKPCNDVTGQCTYTQGYWKNHGPVPSGNNVNVWPNSVMSEGMVLGTVTYSADQLLSIFNTPPAKNGLIALAKQLIAAKLNIANGADASTEISSVISSADALVGGNIIPPVGTSVLASSITSNLTKALTAYNEGTTGPGHCK